MSAGEFQFPIRQSRQQEAEKGKNMSTRSGRALWKFCQIALTFGVAAWLLGAAVALVLAIIAVQESNASLFLRASAGGFVSLGMVWLVGKGVTSVKRRATDLA